MADDKRPKPRIKTATEPEDGEPVIAPASSAKPSEASEPPFIAGQSKPYDAPEEVAAPSLPEKSGETAVPSTPEIEGASSADTSAEPVSRPASFPKAGETSRKPTGPVIDHTPQTKSGSGGGFVVPLASGLAGGMAAGAVVSLLILGNAASKVDDKANALIQSLQQQVKDVQGKSAELSETLRTKLSALPLKAASPDDVGAVRQRLEELAKAAKAGELSVQALAEQVKALADKPEPKSAPVKETVEAEITSRLAPVSEKLAAMESTQKPVSDRLAALERAQSEKTADNRAAAVSIAYTGLKKAITDGKPFASELATIQSLAPQPLSISKLAAYKDTGVPSLAQLQRDFIDVESNAIVKHYHGKASSLVDEMLSRAHGAIQVKPMGGAGDTVEAILGRIEKALKAGNLKTALAESGALDDEAKQQLQGWLKRAEMRAAADDAVEKTDQELLAGLTKSTATQ